MNGFKKKEKELISPVDFHTQVLNHSDAVEFICNTPYRTQKELLPYAIGYFSELGYVPIPLLKEILECNKE